jgi:hypothetical protein
MSNKAIPDPRRHRAASDQKETAMTDSAAFKREAMTSDELDRVAGGIIIIGGFQHRYELVAQTSLLDRVALNPQPLPPRTFSFGH